MIFRVLEIGGEFLGLCDCVFRLIGVGVLGRGVIFVFFVCEKSEEILSVFGKFRDV